MSFKNEVIAETSTKAKMEFAVQMEGRECVEQVRNSLANCQGISAVTVDTDSQKVLVETILPSEQVRTVIESVGPRAVLQGYGAIGDHLGAAVAMLSEGLEDCKIQGVTRFVQVKESTCIIDGTVDGLVANEKHGLFLHEYGDLSNGCESTGPILDFPDGFGRMSDSEPYGKLGNVTSDSHGRASFRFESERVKVYDIIGRAMVVHGPKQASCTVWDRLTCGIVARSSGLFQNTKKICSCDGVALWDERDRPLAGKGRQIPNVPQASL